MTARINPPESPHAGCAKIHYRLMTGPRAGAVWDADINQVRRCEHGIVQICWQPPGCQPVRGREWRDISKFWERKLYRQAVEALEAEEAR